MDVKYIPSDWEKMKDGIGDLIGLGRYGKGMIDELKDLSDILEDAESDIAKYDVDGAITFQHTSQKGKYQGLFEDFDVLHNFSGKVGDIVDRTIDQPFYEDMDAFVAAMRDLSISNYTTTNRIGATEIVQSYVGYGVPQQFEIDKAEVSLDDLFSGDHYYGEQMQLEYEEWKKLNPAQDFSQKEYQQAVLNMHAFEYQSIKDQEQANEEFWGQIISLAVIVTATLIFPPAGITLGAVYGTLELSSAVSGQDWISGRELDTTERWVRGVLAPLDIIPGAGAAVTKFAGAGATGLARISGNVVPTGLKTGVSEGIKKGVTSVKNLTETASNLGAARLKSAGTVIQSRTNTMINHAIKGTIESARMADRAVTGAKNSFQIPQGGPVLAGIGPVGKTREVFENTHTMENGIKGLVSKFKGVNLSDPGLITQEGKRSTRSENSLRSKLESRVDSNGERIYSDKEIDAILDIRNTDFVIKRENGGEDTVIKRHGYLKQEDGQSHHLSQDASFKAVIPRDEGLAIKLEGNIFKDKDSSHYKAHEVLETFWQEYRTQDEIMPTIGQYNDALKNSMVNAGYTEGEADLISEVAAHQQRAYGLLEEDDVIRVPDRIYAVKIKEDD